LEGSLIILVEGKLRVIDHHARLRPPQKLDFADDQTACELFCQFRADPISDRLAIDHSRQEQSTKHDNGHHGSGDRAEKDSGARQFHEMTRTLEELLQPQDFTSTNLMRPRDPVGSI